MRQLVCQSDVMINHMANILNDETITTATGNYLADLLCKKYQPRQETMSFTIPLVKAFKQ